MTAYIVDASVVAEFIVGGVYTPHTRTFFRGALSGDVFVVPDLGLIGCTNVIWKMVRFRGMPVQQATQALRNLWALPLRPAATRGQLGRALEIGLKYHLAIYDSLYIALAVRTGNILVTIDAQQEAAATVEGVKTIPLTHFV